jgi:hypothetical protein
MPERITFQAAVVQPVDVSLGRIHAATAASRAATPSLRD